MWGDVIFEQTKPIYILNAVIAGTQSLTGKVGFLS